MLLVELVATSQAVADEAGRLAKTARLADCLRAAGPQAALAASLLIGLPRQGRIGIGYATLQKVRAAAPPAAAPTLTLAELDAALDRLTAVQGKGAAAERLRLLTELLGCASAPEQAFLVALLVGELRQGALEGVMADAVARAAGLDAAQVRRAAMLAGDLASVAEAALSEGAAGLARFRIELLRPVQPMLAQPAEDTDEAIARFGTAALEYKLDGARVQIHKDGPEVRVFSRRLNDVTAAVPELVEAVQALPARSLILDGETIALDADGRPLPFQITMRRFGRRLDVAAMRASLPLSTALFDCLHLDGADLIDQGGTARFAALAALAPPAFLVPRLVTGQPAAAAAFFEQALAAGHEGIMAKQPDAAYEAGRRGSGWLKVKRAQTLDLVVLAAEWGHGRRRGWLSNLHLGARGPDGGFVMLGKTFKGLTDQMLAWQTEQLQARAIAQDRHTVHVRPELVVEIAFNDIQASPHYPGGMALRFARVKRYRPDKAAAAADRIETVRALFERQSGAP
jgi:DNA ligase-1